MANILGIRSADQGFPVVLKLRNFSNAARQLGSSVGILSSAYHLRERVAQVLYLFHENAADLFPRKVQHQDTSTQSNNGPLRTRRHRPKPPPNVRTPVVTGDLDPEQFPEQMAHFAEDITTFLECLNEFPEFTDEAVNASILAFQGDLKVGWGLHAGLLTKTSPVDIFDGTVLGIVPRSIFWYAGSQTILTRFRLIVTPGQFKYPAIQRYLHDLSTDLAEHIESINSALSLFIDVGKSLHFTPVLSLGIPDYDVPGVPTIRFAQKHGAQNLLNLSTVATFFSSVTATSLQFSFSDTHNFAANAVNAFWFTSLVFSIGEFMPCTSKSLSLITLSSCCCQQFAGADLEAGYVVR